MDCETSYHYLPLPGFDGENYHIWAARMEAYLEENDLWEAVEEDYEVLPLSNNPTMAQIRNHKERKTRKFKARAMLFAVVSVEIFTRIMTIKSAFEIWNFLKSEYEGDERIRGSETIQMANYRCSTGLSYKLEGQFVDVEDPLVNSVAISSRISQAEMDFARKFLSRNNKLGRTKRECLTWNRIADKFRPYKYEVPFAPKKEKVKKFAKERRSKNKKNEVAKKQKLRSAKGWPLTEQQKSKKFQKVWKMPNVVLDRKVCSECMYPIMHKALPGNIDNDVATDMDPGADEMSG